MADSNNGRNSDSDFEEDQPGLDTLLPNLKNVVFIKAILFGLYDCIWIVQLYFDYVDCIWIVRDLAKGV